MVSNPDRIKEGRSHPAHLPSVVRFNTPVIFFVTVCAADRLANTFATPLMHRHVVDAWESATSHKVGAYVLMPDHIHLFCAPTSPEAENVAKWVRYWKSLVTRAIRGRPAGGARSEDERTLVPPVLRPDSRSDGGASVRLPGSEDEQTLVPPVLRPGLRSDGGASVRLPESEDEQTLVPPVLRPGLRSKAHESPIFQRDCWDTQLRRGENYHEKWEYVRNNPVRLGWVAVANEWPFGGVLNDLLW